MEGHVDVPPQNAKDQQELGASGSSPSHLPSWSPARGHHQAILISDIALK